MTHWDDISLLKLISTRSLTQLSKEVADCRGSDIFRLSWGEREGGRGGREGGGGRGREGRGREGGRGRRKAGEEGREGGREGGRGGRRRERMRVMYMYIYIVVHQDSKGREGGRKGWVRSVDMELTFDVHSLLHSFMSQNSDTVRPQHFTAKL